MATAETLPQGTEPAVLWLPVDGWDKYLVSEAGDVETRWLAGSQTRLLSPWACGGTSGCVYRRVELRRREKATGKPERIMLLVHRLVAWHFGAGGTVEETRRRMRAGWHIHHLDLDGSNNSRWNLAAIEPREHAILHWAFKRGNGRAFESYLDGIRERIAERARTGASDDDRWAGSYLQDDMPPLEEAPF